MRSRFAALMLLLAVLLGAMPTSAAPAGAFATVRVAGWDGSALSGAQVELIAPGAGILSAAATGSSGRAALAVRGSAASYWVRVWAAGYATAERPWIPGADGRTVTVEMAPVSGSLAGLVTDHLGQPVSGALVTAWRKDVGQTARTETGANGAYTLRGLAVPGPYQVQVVREGFRPYVAQAVAAAAGEEKRLDVSLAPAAATIAGQVADTRTGAGIAGARVEAVRKGWGVMAAASTGKGGTFVLALPPAESSDYTVRVWASGYALVASAPFALAPGARKQFTGAERLGLQPTTGSVWGIVTDSSGQMQANMKVELQLQGAGTVAAGTTDAVGQYAFDRVEVGTYRVRILGKGSGWGSNQSPWAALTPGASRYFEVALPSVQVRSYGAGTVIGQVFDPQGQPLDGVKITLTRGDLAISYAASTDEQGRYRVTGVDANRAGDTRSAGAGYIVKAEKDGYLPSDQPQGQAVGAQAQPAASLLDVIPDRIAQADFTLRPAAGTVSGAVEDDQGKPIAGARVTLLHDGSGPLGTAATGSDGSYSFGSLSLPTRGGFAVVADKAGYVSGTTDAVLDAAAAPGAAAQAVLRLKPAVARVQGRVVGTLGAPVAGARIEVITGIESSAQATRADEHGWYALDQVPAGPGDAVLLRASADSLPDATLDEGALQMAAARARTVNLQIASGAGVTGAVYGPDGSPLAGATVELRREGSLGAQATAVADEEGGYRFDNLSPGDRYAVVARKSGFVSSGQAPGEPSLTELFTAAPGTVTQLDLGLVAQ